MEQARRTRPPRIGRICRLPRHPAPTERGVDAASMSTKSSGPQIPSACRVAGLEAASRPALPPQLPSSRTKRRSVAVPATGTSELAEALGDNRSVVANERFCARDGRTPNAGARVTLWGKSRRSRRFSRRTPVGLEDFSAFSAATLKRARARAPSGSNNFGMHGFQPGACRDN